MSSLLQAAKAYEALAAGKSPAERQAIARDVMSILVRSEAKAR